MVTSNLVFSQWGRIFRGPDGHRTAIDPLGTPLGRARVQRAELSNRPVAANVAGAVTTASTARRFAGPAVATAPPTCQSAERSVRNRAWLRRRRPERALGLPIEAGRPAVIELSAPVLFIGTGTTFSKFLLGRPCRKPAEAQVGRSACNGSAPRAVALGDEPTAARWPDPPRRNPASIDGAGTAITLALCAEI